MPPLLLLLSTVLLTSPAGIERLKGTPAAEALVRKAEDWPRAHVENFGLKEWALPPEGAGWSHAYVCPVHGVRLKQSHGKNLCPVDGQDYHGWPIDNVVYMQRNGDNAAAVRDLGLAYRLTGRDEFAAKARRILNAYTVLYPKLPVHDNNNKLNTQSGARVMSQTLSEASWLVPLVTGYDLVRDTMSTEERAAFERAVLRNAAVILTGNNRGKSNWQSWHDSALLAIGLEVGDRQMVDKALESFRYQMRESITADGPWFEGSWGYHFYSLDPLLQTIQMAKNAGLPLPEAAAVKRMLDAPLRCVFPDGTLPNFNDSTLVKLSAYARHYATGYRLFGDRRYLPLARLVDPQLPDYKAEAPASEVMPDAGVATLRVRGSDHVVAIKFGPHGGGHGHFDKLTINSYWDGAQQAADPGTQAYAAPTHATWDKTTVAHNTVVLDEQSQPPMTGKLLEWNALPSATEIRVDAGPLQRTLVHTDRYTLDLFDVHPTDGAEHQIDWVYHNYGRLSPDLLRDEAIPPPYAHLSNTTGELTAKGWRALFVQEKSRTFVHMLGEQGTTVVQGLGLGPDLTVPVPFVMARRRARFTRFVSVLSPENLDIARAENGDLTVGGTDKIHVEPGRFSWLRESGGKPQQLVLSGIADHPLLRRSQTGPIQVDWSADGSTVDMFTVETLEGAVRIRAPGAKLVRLNGRKIECRADGDYRWASLPNLGNLEPCQ